MQRVICGLLLGLIWLPAAAPAAPMLKSLPEDGTEIYFFTTAKIGDQQEIQAEYRIRSVGRKQVQGDDCRWIELFAKLPDGKTRIWKVLVPEKAFDGKDNPLSHAKEAWLKPSEGETAERVEALDKSDNLLMLLTAGPEGEAKIETAREKVDWQEGSLECEVETGRRKGPFEVSNPTPAVVEYRYLRHKQAPFGTAGMHTTFEIGGGDDAAPVRLIIDMKLQSISRSATSSLPNVQ